MQGCIGFSHHLFIRTLRTIEWGTRPKWITEERLYALACADIRKEKKTFFLRAMASSDPGQIQTLNIPQNGKPTYLS